jgi:hypothetical protein
MIKTVKDSVPSVFKALEELGTYEVVVGFTDQVHKDSSLKVSQIAYIHEFGDLKFPADLLYANTQYCLMTMAWLVKLLLMFMPKV